MATLYIMPQAVVCDWNANGVFPDVDQLAYRNVEGHGPEKAFRYDGFEKFETDNPNVVHTYHSDTYLRFQSLFQSGTLQVGDKFVLGIAAPEMTELDALWVQQQNTVPGLTLEVSVYDYLLTKVETGLTIDFNNTKTDGKRWDVDVVQKRRYDNSVDKTFNGENQVFWLVAEVTALPAADAWFTDCDDSCIPQFRARAHYNDSCLSPQLSLCAPQDIYDAWTAAIANLTDDVVLWNSIPVDKTVGGWASIS